jgi:hypothetical protein
MITPLATNARVARPFEFVLLVSSCLVRRLDREAFAEHFGAPSEEGVVVFPSLGGDAIMAVPCPLTFVSAYGSIGAFVREAPETQCLALWRSVGEAMPRRVGAKPFWLGIAGGGVSWRHVHLDDRPKYFGYRPYREDA